MAEIVPGVYAITATPFDDQGRVDEDGIASLVEFEIKAGVHGLNVLGIMGEAHKLTEGERRCIAELFLKHVGGRVPVVVGTTHAGVIPATELSREAEAQGASAVMVAPPVRSQDPRGDPGPLPGGSSRHPDSRGGPGRACHHGGRHACLPPGPDCRGDRLLPDH
ncbi:MAG TPA: dihydrodipicolinate synthase family protein [Candidatus Methylomirabilis sp.]|nr:dihydrodipicolinate synthase family protein [Candidatus Methylomirabilis sp.]